MSSVHFNPLKCVHLRNDQKLKIKNYTNGIMMRKASGIGIQVERVESKEKIQ